MELDSAKYLSMIILLGSNLIATFLGIFLQLFLLQRHQNALSITQRIISCVTSGILLGTLLIMILPNSLDLVAHQWHHYHHLGYIVVGLGFFLICIIEELIHLYERCLSNRQSKIENEQSKIVNEQSISPCHQDNQITRLITLVFALGVHYFFNGVLIGGQTSDTGTLWVLLIAICFHMSLVAFSVTLRLLINNKNYTQVFSAMCIWSLMGPVGVFVSLLISSNSSGLNYINGILQCLSAGTFVYITFIDMIHHDLTKSKFYPFLNIILVFTGFMIIVLTSLWHGHSH